MTCGGGNAILDETVKPDLEVHEDNEVEDADATVLDQTNVKVDEDGDEKHDGSNADEKEDELGDEEEEEEETEMTDEEKEVNELICQ